MFFPMRHAATHAPALVTVPCCPTELCSQLCGFQGNLCPWPGQPVCHCWNNLGRATAVRGSSKESKPTTGETWDKKGVKVVVLHVLFPGAPAFSQAKEYASTCINRYKLMSHFRCSCPERYTFACTLKNLNLFSPIYS